MKERYVIGNLKMHWNSAETVERYVKELSQVWQKKKWSSITLVVCPAFVWLERSRKTLTEGVRLGAQDVFWEAGEGAYTGEVSVAMLQSLGVDYVLVGHSDRRYYLGETDEMTARKVAAVIQAGLKAVVCVGETLEERESGITGILEARLTAALTLLDPQAAGALLVTYEPRWAISTESAPGATKTPSADEILEAKVLLKRTLVNLWGAAAAEKVALLYGGSVTADLMPSVCLEPQMDGVLVGGASLRPLELVRIAECLAGGIH